MGRISSRKSTADEGRRTLDILYAWNRTLEKLPNLLVSAAEDDG